METISKNFFNLRKHYANYPKNVCISAGVHFGTCVLPSDNLVSSLNNRLKVQKYRSLLTAWIITLSKVNRDTSNTWNHSKHAK